jgi:hypothetical protein
MGHIIPSFVKKSCQFTSYWGEYTPDTLAAQTYVSLQSSERGFTGIENFQIFGNCIPADCAIIVMVELPPYELTVSLFFHCNII